MSMRAKPSSFAIANIILAIVLALSSILSYAQPAAAAGDASPASVVAADLFFSEYIEGSSNNKALEIYNATGAAVDLGAGGYNVQMFFNGNPVSTLTINLTGTVGNGDVFVLAQSSANATILAQADQTNGAGWFNGDDAVVLRKGTTIIDAFGQIGFDPGTEWGSGLASTADNTLRRKGSVCAGDVDGTNAFDPAVEWDGFATDTFEGLGVHVSNCSTVVVISQVYGGGGNSGATLKNDFIELYNRSGSAVDITGWSVQYASSTGTTWNRTNLSGTIQPGSYYLIQQAAGAGGTVNLPTPNATGTIAMSASTGKVALVNNSTTLSGSCPLANVVDFVGYGAANCYEGTGSAPALTNTTAALRAGNGAIDTDNNAADFATGTPNPRNTPPPVPNLTVSDVSADEGNSGTTSFDFTVSLSAPAAAGGVTFDITTADGTATLSGNDYIASSLVGQSIPAGSSSYLFSVLVNGDTTGEPDETFFVNVTNVTGAVIADGQGQGTIVNDDGTAVTPIHTIQGSGFNAAPGTFTVEAIVVGDYQTQGSGQLRGFFVQEEDGDADADPGTSEGIFVFCTTCPVPVSVGDLVRVTGVSSEFFNMSQLTASTVSSVTVLSTGNPLPTPASITLPVPIVPSGNLEVDKAAINAYYEPFEGMLVSFPATLSVSEYFELARYGQVILNEGGRTHTYTAVNMPTAAGYIEHQIDLARRKVILDDTDNRQNRPVDPPNTAYYHPVPGLNTTNYFRGGDTITNLTGVLHWSFAGQSGTDAWRIRPVVEAYSYAFTPVNPRPAVPTVGGSLKMASFNVLNYFLTIDTSNVCAPTQNQDCRGADSAQELQRQRTKLLAALSAIDADVFGFMEMENTPGVEPLADIVAGLPGYAYIDTGVIGTDAIRVGIIYKIATVIPVGNYAVLTSAFDPRFNDTRNRPALAQSFEEISSGARLTVVVNHLKSKGSGCGAGDDDTTTGQGNCNGTRTLAAQALADWLATDPTGSGDADVLIIGDLNSYAKEDPIVALQNAGYTDLVAQFGGSGAYGYVFDGQLGYLDHALSNASLTPQVASVAEWHINADEIPLFDYNDDERTADEAAFEEESDVFPLYEPNEFRTSDHDPVIIGLNLNGRPTLTADPVEQYVQYSDPIVDVTVTASDVSAELLDFKYESNDNGGDFSAGLSDGLSFSDPVCSEDACELTLSGVALLPPGVYVVRVTATDPDGLFSTIDITLTVTQEDARVTYTGAEFASTANESSSTATITLSATVQDISVTADPGGDEYPGDITNAIVTFVDRDNNDAVLCSGPVGLVDLNDSTTGTATCDVVVDLGNADGLELNIGVVVSGYYTRNSGSDDSIVVVSRPLTTNFITGGGSLLLENSAGQLAGDPGSRNNFGLNVKFNKGGKNLQGRVNTLVRSGGRTYQIKSSALTSLSVQPCQPGSCSAVFNGKATIQDITDPDNPVSIDGNATLQVTLTDAGNDGDTIAITVWNKQGGLWFASNWDGTRTLEQYLASGNVIVH